MGETCMYRRWLKCIVYLNGGGEWLRAVMITQKRSQPGQMTSQLRDMRTPSKDLCVSEPYAPTVSRFLKRLCTPSAVSRRDGELGVKDIALVLRIHRTNSSLFLAGSIITINTKCNPVGKPTTTVWPQLNLQVVGVDIHYG